MKGSFSEDALEKFARLAAEKQGIEFSEGDSYDFARCVRADGSFYGTSGKCRKGTETDAKAAGEGGSKVEKARQKVAEAKASGDKKKLADARHDQQIAERTQKIENEAKKRGVSVDDVIKERNARSEGKIQARLSKEQEERVKRLQDMASKGDKRAMDILKRLRESGRIGKEPGFGPGAKARQETKEAKELGAKPASKPRATTAETKPKWQEAEKVVKEAKARLKKVNEETKGDKSPEARKKRIEAGQTLDKAERLAQKAYDRFSAAAKRESYKAMTPEQRKEEREWRKNLKKYG